MKYRTRQDGVIFLPDLHDNFSCKEVKILKERTIYVWPVCADIIISKEHRTAEVIVYFSSIGENCGRNFSFKFKMQV